jgi:hypothetical protein
MNKKYSLFLSVFFVCFGAQPVFANQPPGPLVALPVISILPLMIIMTILGGGYSVLKRLNKNKHGVLKCIGAVLVIFFSAAHEGLATLVCIVFGIIALIRGIVMFRWGVGALSKEKKPDHLTEASPKRLISSGIVLVLVVFFLAGMSIAFVGYWPTSQKYVEAWLKEFVAHQIAQARMEATKAGGPQYKEIDKDLNRFKSGRIKNIGVEYGKDHKSFVLYLTPDSTTGVFRYPFFPYNYFVSHPSYRADETGRIRMVYVHNRFERCPPDAPVVRTIREAEIRNEMEKIKQGNRGS